MTVYVCSYVRIYVVMYMFDIKAKSELITLKVRPTAAVALNTMLNT